MAGGVSKIFLSHTPDFLYPYYKGFEKRCKVHLIQSHVLYDYRDSWFQEWDSDRSRQVMEWKL